MSIYPIYIDSNVSGAQLSIGTVNTSYVVIGAPTTSEKNTSTVINGVRLDSNKNLSNIIITYANSAITPINGIDNTVVSDGLASNTGSANTAIGSGALLLNTIGFKNTAIGNSALRQNLDGCYNTAIGYNALKYSINIANTAIGNGALSGINCTGGVNTAVGMNTLIDLTIGSNNTAIGGYAGGFSTTGSNNTCIGYNAASGTDASNSTAIGFNSRTNNYSSSTALGVNSTCTASNQIMLGTITENVVVPGNISVGSLVVGGVAYVQYATPSGPTTISPYTTVPTFTNNQIGYTLFSKLSTNVVLTGTTSRRTDLDILSFTLPIGVWHCSYSIRAHGTIENYLGNSIKGAFYMKLSSPLTNYPTIYGATNAGPSTAGGNTDMVSLETTDFPTIAANSGFGIAAVINVSPSCIIISSSNSATLTLAVSWIDTATVTLIASTTNPRNYLTATRIA